MGASWGLLMVTIEPRYEPILRALGLNSFEALSQFFLGDGDGAPASRTPPRTGVRVVPKLLQPEGHPPLAVFFKQYDHEPPSWRFLGRASKARCEYVNYEVFRDLRVAAAERMATGEERDVLGRLRRAFILTVAVPESMTLVEFAKRYGSRAEQVGATALRRGLARQLGRMARRLHAAGFYCHDLVWRNILATWQPPEAPKLWLIDCPRGGYDRHSPWRRRRLLKDLASLDKSGVRYASLAERVAFLQAYLGTPRLGPEGRRLAKDVCTYRRDKWPEDWEGR